MATPLLITRADFNGRVELSGNMHDAKINSRILEAEDFDLRELMGDAFYYSFLASQASAPYTKLLAGGDYVIKDITYTFYGLKPVLVYFAASRIIKQLDMHFTPNGMMQKRNEFSDHIESKDLSYNSNQLKNQALAYWNMCEKYLEANRTDYPLWRPECGCDDGGNKPAPRVIGLGGGDHDGHDYYYRRGYYGGRR